MGSLAGLISGMFSGGGNPTLDLSQLYSTIKDSGKYQRQIINALPDQIKQNLQKYAESQNEAGDLFKTNVVNQGNDYLSKVSGLYGPDSAAANAEKTANRMDIYSTVPGAQTAIRNAMAATGGLQRGAAGVALAQPQVQAAQQYGASAARTNANQTAMGQQATQQALATVNTMNDQMFQQLFGMSKEQATTILNTGNDALRQQLAQLINQSNAETNQTLGAQGLQANNAYQNAVADKENNSQMIGNAVNLGLMGATGGYSALGGYQGIMQGMGFGGGQGLPAGADVSSPYYNLNMNANKPTPGGY